MRRLFLSGVIAIICILLSSAYAEEITLTTYYPAPYGEYRVLQLAPISTTARPTCSEGETGRMYYDSGLDAASPGEGLYYCDGSSWQDVGGVWTQSGGNIYYTGGNVGIGTPVPDTALDIIGDLDVTGRIAGQYFYSNWSHIGTQMPNVLIRNVNGASSYMPAMGTTRGLWSAVTSDGNEPKKGIESIVAGAGTGPKYAIYGQTDGIGTAWAGYFNNGNVYMSDKLGIGTTSPSTTLTVESEGNPLVVRQGGIDFSYYTTLYALNNKSPGAGQRTAAMVAKSAQIGLLAQSLGSNSSGVYAAADNGTGVTGVGQQGMYGVGDNVGVGGVGRTDGCVGVKGHSQRADSKGVYGVIEYEALRGYGVFGEATGPEGTGVYGWASKTAGGTNYGVYGRSDNPSGYDFYAGGAGQNYGYASSIRWKNNIQVIDNALAKVLNLQGVYFDWDKKHGGHHDIGMIAEEVGKEVPEAVGYEEDGIYATGMDYGKLTPVLIEAIKAQQEQIEQLQKENKTLKQRFKALESKIE